jgi:hypothetical protein
MHSIQKPSVPSNNSNHRKQFTTLSAAGHKHYTYNLHVLPMWILCHLYTNCYAVYMNIHVPAQASQQE